MLAHLALQGFDAEPSGILQGDPRIPEDYTLMDEILENERRETVLRSLNKLSEREKRVIELRYGFYGRPKVALEEIGHELGLTRERVRQIEGQALSRLASLRELWAVVD
jgi:RNA polymerase sigma factor (sigma-70 family)